MTGIVHSALLQKQLHNLFLAPLLCTSNDRLETILAASNRFLQLLEDLWSRCLFFVLGSILISSDLT